MPKRSRANAPSARLTWPGKPDRIDLPDARLEPRVQHGAISPDPSQLIAGDSLAAMAALLPHYEGRFRLIYADPPFLTGNRFRRRIGRNEDSRRPNAWLLDDGYDDRWADGDAYLDMLYRRLVLMHRLLHDHGTLYLHLDWHANAYARLLLDEVFGYGRLLNEIVWVYHGPSPIRSAFNRKHDTILAFTKSDNYHFDADAVRVPYHDSTVRTFAASRKAGFGKVPDLDRGKVPEDWWYFPVVARLHNERTGYPTQKPEALLERIIAASSRPGDWVLDPFVGSGTTAVVANRLGRRWVGIDANPRAIATSHERLLRAGASGWQLAQVAGATGLLDPAGPASAALDIGLALDGRRLTATLRDFRPPDPPDADSARLHSVADWVSFWQLDPQHHGVFDGRVGAWRVRRGDDLPTTLTWDYPAGGAVQVAVRLVDVYGRVYWWQAALTVA